MPQIIVTADTPTGEGEPPIMFRERVTVTDFESRHFGDQLVERLGWAVGDADQVNRRRGRRRSRSRVEAAEREVDAALREVDAARHEVDAAQRGVDSAQRELAAQRDMATQRPRRSASVVTTAS